MSMAAPDKGDFFSSGAWSGYVWTSASPMGASTISPMDFKAQTTGMPRCVKGSVAMTTDYSGTAMLGFNIGQSAAGSMGMVTPMKAGVMIDIQRNVDSPLRFQVTSGDGASQQRWCATITGNGGFIPWTSLNTMCWDGTGTAYNKEPIGAVMVLVPGTNLAAVPFDFCVNSLAEADAPAGGAAGSGAAGTGAGTTGGAGAGGMSSMAGTGAAAGGSGATVPPLQGGCDGWATRYWDCCKPHCGWSANVQGGSPLASCDKQDNDTGNPDAANSCQGGPAYFCHSLAPWAVSPKLAYGFAAVSSRANDICGKCYQIDFSGRSHNAGNDPGASALAGKSMIVQAINIGGDVGSNQFDIAVPGGGVGAFNACSSQWGIPSSELGQQYGGFLATCKQTNANDHQALKNCVMQKCQSVFESRNLTELAAGCRWYVEWFEAADNPALKYGEVPCPAELMNKGIRHQGSSSNACWR